MTVETIEQFLARGGQITRCPRAFAHEGHSPQSPELNAVEAEALAQHYDRLEQLYRLRGFSAVGFQTAKIHLFTQLQKEIWKAIIKEEQDDTITNAPVVHSQRREVSHVV